MRRAARVVAGLVLLLAACSAPVPTEEGQAACHNGIDDDGQGGADCEDEKCARFCESSEAACANGIDDDGDQLVDCTDPDCRKRAACATVDAPCDPWTSSGCSGGRACFETQPLTASSPGSYCAVAGQGVMGDPCEAHEECAPRHACAANRCVRRCESHADCPRESACLKDHGVGLCLLPCVPVAADSACSPGQCVPVVDLGFRGIPQLFFCDGQPVAGVLREGATCADVPGMTAPARCAAPGICVPERGLPYGSGRCRNPCALGDDGTVTVPCAQADRRCRAAFAGDPRPLLPGQPQLGLCLTGEVP